MHVWYIKIKNESSQVDAEGVEVKIEAKDTIPDMLQPLTVTPQLTEVGLTCPFEQAGYRKTIRRDDYAFVKVASFVRDPREMWIRLGDAGEADSQNQRGLVFSPYDPHRLDVKVRSDTADTVTAHFLIQLDGNLLTMREITKQ